MKLSIGMFVVDPYATRWRVTSFSGSSVSVRRVEYRASLDGRGPMEWCDTDETRDVNRGNFVILFKEAAP